MTAIALDEMQICADRRSRWLIVMLALSGCLLALASVCIGRAAIAPLDILAAVFGVGDERTVLIVQELRLPRTLLAIGAGAALAMAGAVLQGFLRNPLAESSVLGISTTASLGAVIAIYLGLTLSFPLALPVLAMTGAAIATIILYAVAVRQSGTLTLILAGMGIGGVSLALINLTMSLSSNPWAVSEMVYWLFGSLKNRTMQDIVLVTPFVLIGIALLARGGQALDGLSLGEDAARSLGINMNRLRLEIILGVTFAVGAITAVVGGISAVGLFVPHLMRPIAGHMPSRILLPSALGGAVVLLAADIGIRLLAGAMELSLGVLTALVGAPFFLYLVFNIRREGL